jgi:hypothetical protein
MPLHLFLAAIALLIPWHLASADKPPPSSLEGRVVDVQTGEPVEGVRVHVAGPDRFVAEVATDRAGRYRLALAPGAYRVLFVYGDARSAASVSVWKGRTARLDGRLDGSAGEVIVILEPQGPPAVPAKAKNYKPTAAPPYSDLAIKRDAWSRAWLLLDVSEIGKVTRLKFIKRPGHDLEEIATAEAFKLRFEPGRAPGGQPIKSYVIWLIEWPSYGWLQTRLGTASRMPPMIGFPPRSMAEGVPCAGSGPLELGSVYPVYRDCSVPDLSKGFDTEPWIVAGR